MLEYERRRAIRNLTHALFTACVLAVAVVSLVTLNREPNLQSQMILEPDTRSRILTYTAEKDKTVLEQLQAQAEVEARISRADTRIHSINEVSGQSGQQWQLYIDGRATEENPLTYTTQGGENVEWRLE